MKTVIATLAAVLAILGSAGIARADPSIEDLFIQQLFKNGYPQTGGDPRSLVRAGQDICADIALAKAEGHDPVMRKYQDARLLVQDSRTGLTLNDSANLVETAVDFLCPGVMPPLW